MGIGVATKRRLVEGVTPAAPRRPALRLTSFGQRAFAEGEARRAAIERGWPDGPSTEAVARVQHVLATVVEPGQGWPLLRAAIAPPPGTWRSKVPAPDTLPSAPTVLHRGGFPDGA